MDDAARDELELLFEISRIFGKHVELRAALGPVLKLLETRAGLKRGMVTLLDRAKGMLRVEEASGLASGEKSREFYRLGEGPVGRVFETGMPVTVPDSASITFYCVPVSSGGTDGGPGGGVIGTLSAEHSMMQEKQKFRLACSGSRQMLRFLEKVASIIADAARLRERIFLQSAATANTKAAATLEEALSGLEKELIAGALEISGGNMAAASRRLGITERQMGLRVHHYGINRKLYRG